MSHSAHVNTVGDKELCWCGLKHNWIACPECGIAYDANQRGPKHTRDCSQWTPDE